MKGYRDKDGFHIVLTDTEAMNLITMVDEGFNSIKQRDISNKQLKKECIASAELLSRNLHVIFIADNYREGGATKQNPIEV